MNSTYYATVAQVIPVFVLATIFQTRYIENFEGWVKRYGYVVQLTYVVSAGLAEAVSLTVLHVGEPASGLEDTLIWIGMAGSVIWLFWPLTRLALVGIFGSRRSVTAPTRRPLTRRASRTPERRFPTRL